MLAAVLVFATLPQRMDEIARDAHGRVGAAAIIVESGELVSLHGDEHFPMQSVYKLPIAMALLHREVPLDQQVRVEKSDFVRPGQGSPVRDRYPNGVSLTVRELLRYTVSESDGSTSDVCLRLAGGPQAVMDYLHGIGVNGIMVADPEKDIGRAHDVQYRNWATPNEAVRLLAALQQGRGISPSNRAVLLQMMIEAPTGPHRIKGLLPPSTIVAHKTGTSGTAKGVAAATNDIGLITLPDGRHLAVAVFVSDSRADAATREAVIARIARAAWDASTARVSP